MGMEPKATKNKRRRRPVDRSFEKSFSNYAPPADLTVSQWAEKYRVLSKETTAEMGQWRNSRTPYMVEIMDAFDQSCVHDIAVVAMSQIGKSEVELNVIGKIIHINPGSILYIHPNIDEAKKFSRLRVAPMIRDSIVLRQKVADVKSRDSGNTILQKAFPGGMLTMVGSQTPSALASMPVQYVIGDEIDRWALSAGAEGDPWELAEKRTTTFYNAKRIAVSTPTTKGSSRIVDLYEKGTQEKWYSQCPNCGDWHEILFGDIKFDFDVSKDGRKVNYKLNSVHWCCPSCGCLSTEREMRNAPAKWVAENPDALERGRRTFWVNAFFSPWRSWEAICLKFLEDRKDPQQLKVFYNTILGQLWEDRGDLADEDTMLSRREDYGTRDDGTPVELPEGVLVLTCGVDTQDDRLEYEVTGWGHYFESWGIKRGIIYGDPNENDVWTRLDDVIDHVYKFENGVGLKISRTFVDSGGHKGQSVYKQCFMRSRKQVFAIKGSGIPNTPLVKRPSFVDVVINGVVSAKTRLFTIGVNAAKADLLHGALKVLEPGPRYCHFSKHPDAGYDLDYFNGLLSEVLETKKERGVIRQVWKVLPGHERNEPLDMRNYSYAAVKSLDPNMDAIERRLKERIAGKAPVAKEQKQRPKVKRSIAAGDDW